MTITLRPYQSEAVDALFRYFERSDGHPLVEMPTASGKSLTMAAFVKDAIDRYPDPRDAEIARLNLRVAQLTSGSEAAYLAGRVVDQQHEIGMLLAEVAKRDRALAAGLAALRKITDDYDGAAEIVEAAQEAAMKEGT